MYCWYFRISIPNFRLFLNSVHNNRMDIYAENILEHYKHPHNTGNGDGASVSHMEKNISCGDEITAHITVSDDKITNIEWQGAGCAISQAGMSMLSDELKDMSLEDVSAMKKDTVYELFGVPIGPRRFKCALLCLHAVKNAILIYEQKEPQSWLKTVEIDED